MKSVLKSSAMRHDIIQSYYLEAEHFYVFANDKKIVLTKEQLWSVLRAKLAAEMRPLGLHLNLKMQKWIVQKFQIYKDNNFFCRTIYFCWLGTSTNYK